MSLRAFSHIHLLAALLAVALPTMAIAADAGGDLLGGAAPAPVATTAADADILKLIADGKAAAARYNANQAANAGAIVDAAVFFETARQHITGSTDRAVVTDIQENLFWCRKQMDLDALTAFKARMRNEVAKAPAPLKLKPMAGPPPPAPAKTETAVAVVPDDQAKWIDRLRLRMRASIEAGRPPQFQSSLLKSTTTVTAVAADGTLSVTSDNGGMIMPWKLLTPADHLGIALDVTHDDVPEQHALAAYFLMRSGDKTAAQLRLAKAGAAGDEVAAAFAKPR